MPIQTNDLSLIDFHKMPIYDKTIYDLVEVDQDYFAQNPDAWGDFYSKLKNFPQGVIDVLFGVDTPDILETICSNYPLNQSQIITLSRLIRSILVADIYIGDMPVEIAKSLNLDPTTSKNLATQIISQLFAASFDDIKKLQALRFPNKAPLQQPTTQPVTPAQQFNVPKKFPGSDLPETGGNIIDLRNQK